MMTVLSQCKHNTIGGATFFITYMMIPADRPVCKESSVVLWRAENTRRYFSKNG